MDEARPQPGHRRITYAALGCLVLALGGSLLPWWELEEEPRIRGGMTRGRTWEAASTEPGRTRRRVDSPYLRS